MAEAPPHRLGDPGVHFIDADGDGRADLIVTAGVQAGYFPLTFSGGWSRRSFQPYRQVAQRRARRPEGAAGRPRRRRADRRAALGQPPAVLVQRRRPPPGLAAHAPRRVAPVPDVDLADPHVRLADMTGDGLQDIVAAAQRQHRLLAQPRSRPVRRRWCRCGAPRGCRRASTPRRVLLGDVDGDGVADLVYVDRGRVLLWGNRTGNAWTPQPVVVPGTPDVVDADAVQLADLHGTGMAGLLYSRAADGSGQARLRFLDFTGGAKPYLLDTMDNHLGARTTVQYRLVDRLLPPRPGRPRDPLAHHAAVPGARGGPGRGARRRSPPGG